MKSKCPPGLQGEIVAGSSTAEEYGRCVAEALTDGRWSFALTTRTAKRRHGRLAGTGLPADPEWHHSVESAGACCATGAVFFRGSFHSRFS